MPVFKRFQLAVQITAGLKIAESLAVRRIAYENPILLLQLKIL
jgi:hypothetical protein